MQSKLFSLITISVGLVLLGAGCAPTAPAVDTGANIVPVDSPAPVQPGPDSLPTSNSTNPVSSKPESKPAETIPSETTPPAPDQPTPELTPTPKKVSVAISGFAYQPSSITINKGDTVVWTNNDSVSHNVVSPDDLINSPTLGPGQSFSYKFISAGTYSYLCTFHGSMNGTVIVK